MQELLLFIIVIAVLIVSTLAVKQLKRPALQYIHITVSLGLLALIWVFSENGNYGPKTILTAVALGSTFKQVLNLNKYKTDN